MVSLTFKPSEFYFSIQYDPELGGFYSVFANIEDEYLFTRDLMFLLPSGFYPLSTIENIFGFDMKPGEARRILSSKGFVENLDLI